MHQYDTVCTKQGDVFLIHADTGLLLQNNHPYVQNQNPSFTVPKITSSRLQSWTPYVTEWKVFFSLCTLQVIQLHMHAFIYSALPVQTKRSIHENNFILHIFVRVNGEQKIVNSSELFSFADFSTVFHKSLPCFLHIQFMALLMKRSHRTVWYVWPYKVCGGVQGCVSVCRGKLVI